MPQPPASLRSRSTEALTNAEMMWKIWDGEHSRCWPVVIHQMAWHGAQWG